MKTKLTDYLPLAAIAAGALLLKKQSVSGIGRALDYPRLRKEVDDYMSANEKPCKETLFAYYPSLNKQDSIADYIAVGEEFDNGQEEWHGPYRHVNKSFMHFDEKTVCTSKINFTQNNYLLYEFFCNSLMTDYSVLKGRGGSNCDDPRLDAYSSWGEVPRSLIKELRDDNCFYNGDCILILFNGIPQFIINPEGYSYARYIGFLPTFNTWLV